MQQLVGQNEYLGTVISEKDKAIQNLITHSQNLAGLIDEKDKIIKQSEEETRDLETRLLASLEQNSFLAGRVEELEASLDNYYKHAQNLELIVNRPIIKFLRACKRILSLRK